MKDTRVIEANPENLYSLFEDLLAIRPEGVYLYKGDGEDEEGSTISMLKGLAYNDEGVFIAQEVPVDKITLKELYLFAEDIDYLLGLVGLAENLLPEPSEDEDDESAYAVNIRLEQNDDDSWLCTVSPSTGDPVDREKTGGFFTIEHVEGYAASDYPAVRVSEVIQGTGLDIEPNYADATGTVPDGPVSVWSPGAKDPLETVLKIARKRKVPLALMRHHASRIHTFRIGEDLVGAISPIPMNAQPEALAERSIFNSTVDLDFDYNFDGLRKKDGKGVTVEEPSQEAPGPEEEPEEDEPSQESPETEEPDEEPWPYDDEVEVPGEEVGDEVLAEDDGYIEDDDDEGFGDGLIPDED